MAAPEATSTNELLMRTSAARWLKGGFGRMHFNFGAHPVYEAVSASLSLNHLLNLTELRKFNSDGKFFDQTLLTDLRDRVFRFATLGDANAHGLPLTRSNLEKFDLRVIHNIVGEVITPAYHASPQFTRDIPFPEPIAGRDDLITYIDIFPELDYIHVTRRRGDSSQVALLNAPPRNIQPKTAQLDYSEAVHIPGTRPPSDASISVYRDKSADDFFWIKLVVDTKERGVSPSGTPYLVGIAGNHESMKEFVRNLKIAFDRCADDQDKHKLLYYLTSVLYFQSDPDLPYLPPTVSPTKFNKNLPNLGHIPLLVDKLEEVEPLFDQALAEDTGFKALRTFIKRGSKDMREFQLAPVLEELRKIFGPDYSALESMIKTEISILAELTKEQLKLEIGNRAHGAEAFISVWENMKQPLITMLIKALLCTKQEAMKAIESLSVNKVESFSHESAGLSKDSSNIKAGIILDTAILAVIVDRMNRLIGEALTSRNPDGQFKKLSDKFIKEWEVLTQEYNKMFERDPSHLLDDLCIKLHHPPATNVNQVLSYEFSKRKRIS